MVYYEPFQNVRSLTLLYERSFCRSMSEYSLTQTEVDILGFLHLYPAYDTAKKICEFRNLPKSNVSIALDKLIKKGYISTRRDTEDRRVVHLTVMPVADSAVRSIMDDYTRFHETILEGFTEEDKRTWYMLSKRMNANIARALGKKADENAD